MCIVSTNGYLVNERMEQDDVLQIVILPMVIALCLGHSPVSQQQQVLIVVINCLGPMW